ncbi:MAG: M20 family metallo-hydrolase [Rhizobiaceae bacterium]|nr:M20 family metallo-hydrolase [Rhizobiaceae bacterium]
MTLAQFGAVGEGGVDRPALSDTEANARARIVAWARALDMRPYTDRVANLFLRFEGTDPTLPPVLVGSHIDSQPTGGRFDGVYGVLAGLEVVQAILVSDKRPRRAIEVVAWTNEEGSRFAPGMTGSYVFTEQKSFDEVASTRDGQGIKLEDAAAWILQSDQDVELRDFGREACAYVEAHIEQGPLLQREGVPVGIVTGIQGTRRYRVSVDGAAAHAGTASREDRRDALMTAVRIIAALDDAADIAGLKCTVGLFNVVPNAPSVVPSNVVFSVDIRHPDNEVVDMIDGFLKTLAVEHRGRCTVSVRQIAHAPSLTFSRNIQNVIAEAAASAGVPCMSIYSSAGHDARQLHYFCPTGMIFIPCRDGVSHNPEEWAEPEHVTAGAKVLCETVWRLANDD